LALLEEGDPGRQAFVWLDDAMQLYEQAEKKAAAGNDDAILRWNSCARIIERNALGAEEPRAVIDDGDGAPRR